jgi:hypothetical protein
MKSKDLPFTVPEGYFERLPSRIMQRCDEREAARGQRLLPWGNIRSQLAFAAGFALLVGLSYMAARYAPRLAQASADAAYAAYNVSLLDLENFLLQTPDSDDDESDSLDDDAIVDYLLCDSQIQIAMEVEY